MNRHTPPEPDGPVEIFRAGWQGTKVRAVQVLVLVVMVPALLWGAVDAALNAGEIRSQAGEVVSWPVRYGTAAFMLALAVGAAVGMVVYGWCYVTRAVWDPASGRCRLTLAGLGVPARLEVPAAAVAPSLYQHGQGGGAGILVSAPWYRIRVGGRRLPLVLDAQGEFLHPALVDRVLLGRVER
jgi:hypothetical protein